MNQTIEKWLTIAALAGWIASIGSLLGLAVRATAPAVAFRSTQISQISSVNMQNGEGQLALPTNSRDSVETIPLDTSRGYWVEALRARSYRAK